MICQTFSRKPRTRGKSHHQHQWCTDLFLNKSDEQLSFWKHSRSPKYIINIAGVFIWSGYAFFPDEQDKNRFKNCPLLRSSCMPSADQNNTKNKGEKLKSIR